MGLRLQDGLNSIVTLYTSGQNGTFQDDRRCHGATAHNPCARRPVTPLLWSNLNPTPLTRCGNGINPGWGEDGRNRLPKENRRINLVKVVGSCRQFDGVDIACDYRETCPVGQGGEKAGFRAVTNASVDWGGGGCARSAAATPLRYVNKENKEESCPFRVDLPWRSRFVRRRSGVREVLDSNPRKGMAINLMRMDAVRLSHWCNFLGLVKLPTSRGAFGRCATDFHCGVFWVRIAGKAWLLDIHLRMSTYYLTSRLPDADRRTAFQRSLAIAAILLACAIGVRDCSTPSTATLVQFPAGVDPGFSHVRIVLNDTAGKGSPVSPALTFRLCPTITSLHPHRPSKP
ncbi:hypothetical protein PR048_021874 [Dryococelus australis]|uniref:Uncharacterized protein n=1 Tax=Dryococelus australis TaxID=614101 RepID=A0ABQ9GZG9_9NEOP|nr:hypothetical protein PR048_021874 [Dryococelus australis]